MDDKRRMQLLTWRRTRGVQLQQQGVRCANMARRVGAMRQSVMRWGRALKKDGFEKLTQLGVRGLLRQLSDGQLAELALYLKEGSIAAGYATDMCTLPRIGALIQEKFAVPLVPSSVWRVLRTMGWSGQ